MADGTLRGFGLDDDDDDDDVLETRGRGILGEIRIAAFGFESRRASISYTLLGIDLYFCL